MSDELIYPFRRTNENFTMISNALFDDIMPMCTPMEWKVLCLIFRKTYGWNKIEDQISYSQIMSLANIVSPSSVSKVIKALIDKNFIDCRKTEGNTCYYSVNESYTTRHYKKCSDTTTKNVVVPLQKMYIQNTIKDNINTKESPEKDFSEKEQEVIKPTQEEIDKTIKDIENGTNVADKMILSMIKNKERTHLKNTDKYPEKVRSIVALFCKYWGMVAPPPGSSGYSDWKRSTNEIADLIGSSGFGVEKVIGDVYKYIKTPDGEFNIVESYSRFDVSRPGSIYNAVNLVIGKLRNGESIVDNSFGKTYYTPDGNEVKW